MPPAAPYLLSLCQAVESSGFPLGVVSRSGSKASTFQVDAAKLIYSIVEHSPASEFVASEFLFEFQKIWGINDLVDPVVRLRSSIQPEQWAKEILAFLRERELSELQEELKPVLDLASKYFNHLLIAARNPGGKKTPQESTSSTPDVVCSRTINELLHDAVGDRKQSALKALVYKRDGYRCHFTGYRFGEDDLCVDPRCTHILPFSFHDKPLTLKAFESFTGHTVSAETVRQKINHPCNAFNTEVNVHNSFNNLSWGIEAQQQPGGEYKYFFRLVRKPIAATLNLHDGDEILFCKGEAGQMIDAPDPSFCNARLAIACIMHARGASRLIDELYGDDDDEEIVNQPVYLGGPFVSDDTLFRRLHDRLPAFQNA